MKKNALLTAILCLSLSPILTTASGKPYAVAVATAQKKSPAGQEVALDVSTRKRLNVFFSNFAEAFVDPFEADQVTDTDLISFAITHHWINNPKLFEPAGENLGRLSAKYVDSAAEKYFGRSIRQHQSIPGHEYRNGYYLMPYASGEAYRFTQVWKLFDLGNKYYLAYLNVYTASSGFTGDPNGTPEDWLKDGEDPSCNRMQATIRQIDQDGRSRYVLVDYLLDSQE